MALEAIRRRLPILISREEISRLRVEISRLEGELRSLKEKEAPELKEAERLSQVDLNRLPYPSQGSKVPPVLYKPKPYDEHWYTVAPSAITDKGDHFDLRRFVDFITVIPTVDALIEFDTSFTDTTPVQSAGVALNASLRVRDIRYKSATPGTKGILIVYAYWYKGPGSEVA